MIPTLLLAGLVVGRWWFVLVAAVVWPVLLVVDGVDTGPAWDFALGAGALAAANTAVGVAVHRAAVVLVRRLLVFLRHPIGSHGGAH